MFLELLYVGIISCVLFTLILLHQTPERRRPTPPRDGVRTRAASPRRIGGESRYLLPPRIHRASDPGLPPGITAPRMLWNSSCFCFTSRVSPNVSIRVSTSVLSACLALTGDF